MGFWTFLLVIDLLIPISMFGIGWAFMKHPPKDINAVYGYRTTMSMKNMDTWKFAHKYCGKLWYYIGMAMTVLTVIAFIFLIQKERDTISDIGTIICFIQLVPLVGTIILTEIALKKKFDKQGNSRNKIN